MIPGCLEVGPELALVDLGEEVLEAPVIALEDRVLGREIYGVTAVQAIAHRGPREVADRVVEVVHRHRDAAAGKVIHVELDRLGTVLGGVGERQRPLSGDDEVRRPVLVTEGVAADHDRLCPARHQPGDIGDHDRLAEDDATEDVADRPVRRAVHLLQAELLDPGLIGRDRRALDPDAVLLDRIGRIHRYPVLAGVAALDPEVEVDQLEIEVGQDQLLLDEGPDDPGHLVAVELDDRVGDFDLLRHRRAMLSTRAREHSREPRLSCENVGVATVARPSTSRETHEVFNQPPPLEDYNPFDSDRPLAEALRREGAEWAEERARELGAICGSHQTIRWGFEANERKPELHTHDRYGNRIDEVEFHSAWHELMRIGIDNGLHAAPWREPGPGAHVARAAMFMLLIAGRERRRLSDLDDLLGDPGAPPPAGRRRGVGAAVPVARLRRALNARRGQARGALRDGDDREAGRLRRPRQHDDRGRAQRRRPRSRVRDRRPQVVLLGADVRCLPGPGADRLRASPASCCRAGRPTASATRFHIQRLKDKLGNRSNASSEVEFAAPGRG